MPWLWILRWAVRPIRFCTFSPSPRQPRLIFPWPISMQLSRKIPVLCKVAPSSSYHMEDVSRAGGIMAILGELARAQLIDTFREACGCPESEERA